MLGEKYKYFTDCLTRSFFYPIYNFPTLQLSIFNFEIMNSQIHHLRHLEKKILNDMIIFFFALIEGNSSKKSEKRKKKTLKRMALFSCFFDNFLFKRWLYVFERGNTEIQINKRQKKRTWEMILIEMRYKYIKTLC